VDKENKTTKITKMRKDLDEAIYNLQEINMKLDSLNKNLLALVQYHQLQIAMIVETYGSPEEQEKITKKIIH